MRIDLHSLRQQLRAELLRQHCPAFDVADVAPNNERDLLHCWGATGKLVVWSGGSDRTIWGDPAMNWRFRAWHDATHLASGQCGLAGDDLYCFSVAGEIETAKYQIARTRGISDALARVLWAEIAGQATHYGLTGTFVDDQVAFTLASLEDQI